MIDLEKLVRKNIKDLKPYSSARDEYTGNGGIMLDANENPFGAQNRYPDPYQRELKTTIALQKEVSVENIFLGNGSDEIIDLCFRVFCEPKKDKALQFTPTYGMYKVSADINDVEMDSLELNEEFKIPLDLLKVKLQDPSLKLIFICSPNNPTGNSIDENDIRFILEQFNGIVILDEAYIDFSSKSSFLLQLDNYSNLIVLQTFSKAWAHAGIRIGMAFANKEIVSYFNKVKPPYNISSLNQKAAIEALANADIFKKNIEIIKGEKKRMLLELSKLSNVKTVFDSDANFLLIRFSNHEEVFKKLLEKKIVVRNRSSEVRSTLRITIGSPMENDILLKELGK